MPSNVFANTGTNVSVIFLDKANKSDKVLLMDASKLGTKQKDGKNKCFSFHCFPVLSSEYEPYSVLQVWRKAAVFADVDPRTEGELVHPVDS